MTDCIFCKIVAGDIPARKVYEDDDVLVFHDIKPAADVHLLLIPKVHVESLAHCDDGHAQVLSRLMLLAPKLAAEHGLEKGFKTAINTGVGGGQEVFHLHVHVYGNR